MKLKKKFIILRCVLTIIVGITVVGVVYAKTDVLKTKEQLFWKYMLLEKDEIINVLSNNETKAYDDVLKNSFYIKEGNISITSKFKLIKPVNIKIVEKGNNVDECKNMVIDLDYADTKVANATIVKDEDYFLVKDNLKDSKFIGFENNNLKELAQTIGITSTNYIPDRIKEIDYSKLLSVSDSEMNYILKKYIPICRKIINNKDYCKRTNVKLNNENTKMSAYELMVTDEQLYKLLIELLKELYKDDRSLEFIGRKIEILDNENLFCEVDYIRNKISELIQNLENKEVKNDNILSIIIYSKEKNVIKTELVLKNSRTISIEAGNNKISIKQYDVKEKQIKLNTVDECAKTILDSITQIDYSKSIANNTSSKVDVNIVCKFGIECITLHYDCIEQIKDNIEGIIHKNEIEYIDLRNLDSETCKIMLKKLREIGMFKGGKNY